MRCWICDSTHDGNLTDIPWKFSRKFDTDMEHPHLLICSDCDPRIAYQKSQAPEDLEPGEIPNVESMWDD